MDTFCINSSVTLVLVVKGLKEELDWEPNTTFLRMVPNRLFETRLIRFTVHGRRLILRQNTNYMIKFVDGIYLLAIPHE